MVFWFCVLASVIWLGLAFLWHQFWRVDQRLNLNPAALVDPPSVVAIVPARNEQEVIATSVEKLLAQDYSGDFSIIVANDSSTDSTANILANLHFGSGLSIVDTKPLPDSWAGKMWALHSAIETCRENPPQYYWLTDADIAHSQSVLTCLVAHAQTNRLAMVSQMVRLHCQTFGEKLLVPAFIFYFALIYPFRAVNNPASSIAAAAGGSILIRSDALENIGGIEALKGAVIDDCTLARLVKKSGRTIWLGFGERSMSLRGYDGLAGFWQMVKRSAYTQLHFSPLLLMLVIVGIVISHLLPVLFLCWPTLAIMAFIYWPTVRFYGLSPVWSLTLPIAALLFGAMTISSALAYHLGWQNTWRDRDIGQK